MTDKPAPKSLHTVTVLVQVARREQQRQGLTSAMALDEARCLLGLAGRPDPHGLAAAALKQLEGTTK